MTQLLYAHMNKIKIEKKEEDRRKLNQSTWVWEWKGGDMQNDERDNAVHC
jgi:hypothetical protein